MSSLLDQPAGPVGREGSGVGMLIVFPVPDTGASAELDACVSGKAGGAPRSAMLVNVA